MIIEIKNLSYVYNPGTPFEKKALDDISLGIEEGEFIGLIGHTGSGKSTLVQHLNGLIKPTSGEIIIDGDSLSDKSTKLKNIRQKVGLVFQYPEHQLFEETIYKDIAFGPKNLGLSQEEVDERVRHAMDLVGLDFEELKDRSPFELSGGQKRRVAIAGVVAMKPKVLVLDEPTAGLDPKGRDDILDEIRTLYEKENITIILVSHSMEDIARLVNRIFVMHRGRLAMDGSPREIFGRSDELEGMGLGIPQITKFMKKFKASGHDVKDDVLTIEEAKVEILKYLRGKKDA
ncbi:energy-coupling factor transporter ATPase [Gudongella oleilytica]|jgi:energy-coupling factor transport system ATP-binding protein|uniref:energy-coupling factor transporter ATPase n=1 Tax=Gudongella oleilytica TaxID=1582259 RepID=UPI000EE2D67B|nr:energy-coupling factor transporter ATPase [Gudongella oleilytica]MDY0256682.1 energy-coupling factor transporter ATPase [Gudongella oleilytica]HCO18101.1 energy-coupling factor transporter ATPase [Tissierellales bacterium]HMM69614.1 energy-coupling factor transporter ATPase [Gudongella oleilytica]